VKNIKQEIESLKKETERLRKQEKKEKAFLRKNKVKIEVIKRKKGYTPRSWESSSRNYDYTLGVSINGKRFKTIKETAVNQDFAKARARSKIYKQLKNKLKKKR